jgi:hypothetical protein
MRAHLNEADEARTTELWEAWRLAEIEAELALDAWYQASKRGKARAYAAYSAALELEALAAEMLAFELASELGVDGALVAS